MSAIDIAVWDVIGRAASQPVCAMLGARNHERIKACASTLFRGTPETMKEAVRKYRALGFQAMKFGWGVITENPRRIVRLVEAARPYFMEDGERTDPLFWEHEGNAAVRVGRWKLVRKYPGPWELYDLKLDRSECTDLAAMHPDKIAQLTGLYAQWAERCGVIPWDTMLRIIHARQEASNRS